MGWDLAPAGFTDDYTGTLADLVFQPGEFGPQAIVTVGLDEPFTRDDGTLANERTIYLRIQRGFDVAPDGTLIHESGDKDKKMKSDGSQWVKFAERVSELVPDVRSKVPGGITDSRGWGEAGLRFHFMTEGAGAAYKFKDESGEEKSGKTKGFVMPVEYLGTKDQPLSGSVGASTNGSAPFSIVSLPDAVIEAWGPLAEASSDNGAFQSSVLKSGLLTKDALAPADYNAVTAALGDGSLREALSPLV
jgi:hypothetical protein